MQKLEITQEGLVRQAREEGVEKWVVSAVVADDEGKVLLLKRHPQEVFLAGLVELPGGTVEQGESLLEALARELQEETGLCVTEITAYIGAFDYHSQSGRWTRQFNFCVRAQGDIVLSVEHSDYYLIHPCSEALMNLRVSPETLNIIRERCTAS